MSETVWLKSPDGEEREFEATPEVLVPLMVRGWSQIQREVNDVSHADAGNPDRVR
jgi:hypothetical protein